jgi:hypothetical protein
MSKGIHPTVGRVYDDKKICVWNESKKTIKRGENVVRRSPQLQDRNCPCLHFFVSPVQSTGSPSQIRRHYPAITLNRHLAISKASSNEEAMPDSHDYFSGRRIPVEERFLNHDQTDTALVGFPAN